MFSCSVEQSVVTINILFLTGGELDFLDGAVQAQYIPPYP
ncbi:hypothetical protein EC253486_5645 [Escherichia coli 2534-86]|nr:hypothetical protein EC253486_5645 [Escherichia coli 2534-86]